MSGMSVSVATHEVAVRGRRHEERPRGEACTTEVSVGIFSLLHDIFSLLLLPDQDPCLPYEFRTYVYAKPSARFPSSSHESWEGLYRRCRMAMYGELTIQNQPMNLMRSSQA